MKDIRVIQLLWSGFLTVAIGFPALTSNGWIGAFVASLLVFNLIACATCFWNFRLSWLVAMIFVSFVLLQQLYANLSLTLQLTRGTEPNTLSTILLIAVNTTLLIAPATFICIGYFINRRQITDILMRK